MEVQFFSTCEAAEQLGYSRQRIVQLIQEGLLKPVPGVKARGYLLSKREIDSFRERFGVRY